MKTTKRKLRWLQFFSWFSLLTPLATIVGINFTSYFSVKPGFTKIVPQYVEVAGGFIVLAIGGGLLALGKTSLFKGSRLLIFALVLSVLLKAIIGDIVLLLTGATIGSVVHGAFQPFITKTKKLLDYEEQAEAHATAMENVIKAQKKVEVVDGSV